LKFTERKEAERLHYRGATHGGQELLQEIGDGAAPKVLEHRITFRRKRRGAMLAKKRALAMAAPAARNARAGAQSAEIKMRLIPEKAVGSALER
jgi:hypothetical protein